MLRRRSVKSLFFGSMFVAGGFAASALLLACGGETLVSTASDDAGLDGSTHHVARDAGAVDAGPVLYASAYDTAGHIDGIETATGYATKTIDLIFPETPNGFFPYALTSAPSGANLFVIGTDTPGENFGSDEKWGHLYLAAVDVTSGTVADFPIDGAALIGIDVIAFVAADNGSLYAALERTDDGGYFNHDVIVLSPSGQTTATIAFPPPYASSAVIGLAYSSVAKMIYALVSLDDTLTLATIDTATNTVTNMVPVHPNPSTLSTWDYYDYWDPVASSDGAHAFLLGPGGLHVVDLPSGAAHDIAWPPNTSMYYSANLLVSPDNSAVYVAAGTTDGDQLGGIVQIDLASQSAHYFQLPDDGTHQHAPSGPLAFDPSGKILYVSAIENGSATVPAFDTVARTFSMPLNFPPSEYVTVTGLIVH